MTDDPVENALKGLAAELDVHVSPEFATRVRIAVEARRPPTRGWIWGIAGLAAAACVAVGVGMLRPGAVPDAPSASPNAIASHVGAGFSRSATGLAKASPDKASPKRSQSQTYVRDIAAAPTEEALALNRLLLGLRSGRTHVSEGIPAPVDQDGLLLTLTPIEIPLIRIAPIEIQPLPSIEPLGPPEGQR